MDQFRIRKAQKKSLILYIMSSSYSSHVCD